jgi:murein DD-endopeptidase MepM/ murein hydrolase activator NlpD
MLFFRLNSCAFYERLITYTYYFSVTIDGGIQMFKLTKNLFFKGFVALLMFFLLVGCSTTKTQTEPQTRAPVIEGWQHKVSTENFYIVQKGDTLYSIAKSFGIDLGALAKANKIAPPYYTLEVGQKLLLVRTPSAIKSQKASAWIWPTSGKVVQKFGEDGARGIDIAGNLGDPIYAVADGKVVYSGTGIKSYGNLVVIKHGSGFLSAYSNNKSILVIEGQYVRVGQEIAEMGANSANIALLHFEIRQGKKALDPLTYLPKNQ